MADELSKAREAIQRASEATDNSNVRKQLKSVDEGLMEMTESETEKQAAKTTGDEPQADRLDQVERKVVGLADEVEGGPREHLEDARDHLDAYRRRHAQDW